MPDDRILIINPLEVCGLIYKSITYLQSEYDRLIFVFCNKLHIGKC